MKSYVLNWAGSGATSEIFADDDEAAIEAAKSRLGDDVVVAENWDSDGWNAADEPCKRLLFWATEEDADNDAGQNALAELSTVGSP